MNKTRFAGSARAIWLAAATFVMFAATISPVTAEGVDREDGLSVFNSDVYVQGEFGLLENPSDLTLPEAPLFNVVGTGLGVTWGEWSSASASAMTVQHANPTEAHTDVIVRLEGLIPNGVYSLFYVTFGPDSHNPDCVNAERGIPLTALRPDHGPDASSFVADRYGVARYRARVDGLLLDADRLDYVLIYHSDGQTYHPLANYGEFATQDDEICHTSYGADAMRQLIIEQSGLR